MDGNIELAMVLCYFYLYSVASGSMLMSDLIANDRIILTGYVAEIFVCSMLRYYRWSCLAMGSRANDSGLSFTQQGKFFFTDIDSNKIIVAKCYLETLVELVCYEVSSLVVHKSMP